MTDMMTVTMDREAAETAAMILVWRGQEALRKPVSAEAGRRMFRAAAALREAAGFPDTARAILSGSFDP
jgi:hypothetical protein